MKKHNEYSQEHILYLKKIKKRNVIITVLRFSILIVFLLLWEIFERVGIIDGFLMSSPSRILATIKDLHSSGDLYRHVGATLYETLLGFFIATLSGYHNSRLGITCAKCHSAIVKHALGISGRNK